MSQRIEEQLLVGERALFAAKNLEIYDTTFADGESPLKESQDIILKNCLFKWKYPLWYSRNIQLEDCTLFEMARAGIWYTENISLTNCTIEAPKNFRRAGKIRLNHVGFANASETLWECREAELTNVRARGDYFGMNSSDVAADGLELVGNYAFDGAKNLLIRNSRMLTKDAFWNCENVTIYDSHIYGQYFGWNSKNVRLIRCTVESNQGFCYMENVKLEDCKLLNTDLAFEYATVEAEINSSIDSVKNPISGSIKAKQIKELIFDDPEIDRNKTKIVTEM